MHALLIVASEIPGTFTIELVLLVVLTGETCFALVWESGFIFRVPFVVECPPPSCGSFSRAIASLIALLNFPWHHGSGGITQSAVIIRT